MDVGFPPSGLPSKTTIDVWRIDLDCPALPGFDLEEILSAEERSRAERFVFARDRARFRMCRGMLRVGLGWYLELSPKEIFLSTNSYGKPRLNEGSLLRFNVTHCNGLGLIAFTTVGEVGIDVESTQRDVEAMDITSAYFTTGELVRIQEATGPRERRELFLRFWTRKEAVLKAAGVGIQLGLDTVDVSEGSKKLVALKSGVGEPDESCWKLLDLEMEGGFLGALAAPPGNWSVMQWPMRCGDTIERLGAKIRGLL